METFRNNLAHKLSSWVMQRIATQEYAGYMALMIQYGMLRLAQDDGDVGRYKEYWTPTNKERYSMLGSFLDGSEAITLATKDNNLVFITKEGQKVRIVETNLVKEPVE